VPPSIRVVEGRQGVASSFSVLHVDGYWELGEIAEMAFQFLG
jgi:hypothetical protein